jgi:hypothetical protein
MISRPKPFGAWRAPVWADMDMLEQHILPFEIEAYINGRTNKNDRLRIQNHTWLCDECFKHVALEGLQLSIEERYYRLMFREEPVVNPDVVGYWNSAGE